MNNGRTMFAMTPPRTGKTRSSRHSFPSDWDDLGLLFYDYERSKEEGGELALLADALVSKSLPAWSSARDVIETIVEAANPPIKIVEAPDSLAEPKYPRGRVLFGRAVRLLDQHMRNYRDDLYWWLSAAGLHITPWLARTPDLNAFDSLVGKRMHELRQGDKWSREAVQQIAAEVDAAGFDLKKNLTKTQWEKIASRAMKSRSGIRTFAAVAAMPALRRSIQLRFYTAHDRYIRDSEKEVKHRSFRAKLFEL